jgi:hypothetical protein
LAAARGSLVPISLLITSQEKSFQLPTLSTSSSVVYRNPANRPPPSFAFFASRMVLRDRTKQADFFSRIRSRECVGLRREKSLFSLPISSFLISNRAEAKR